MYRFKNIFKKATALTVAAVLVLSLFSGSFSSLALTLGQEFTLSADSPGAVATSDLMESMSSYKLPSEIFSTPYAVYCNGSTSTPTSFDRPERLIDYSMADGTDSTGRHFYTLKDGKAYTDTSLDAIQSFNDGAYTMVVISFKTPIKLKGVVMATMHRNANWRVGKYEIYASAGRGELFLDESRIYSRDNTTDKNQIELYTFKDGKELRYINHIALRIYQPHTTYDLGGQTLDSGIRPRLFEFNAYGTPEDPDYDLTQDFTVNYNMDSIDTTHTVRTATSNYTVTVDGVTNPVADANGNQINDYDITKGGYFSGSRTAFFDLIDGKTYNDADLSYIKTRHVNGLNKNTGNEQYMTIEHELLSEVDIEDILVVNHANVYLMTGHYEIFASATKADLYKNSVLRFDNTNVKKQIQNIHFDTDKQLKGIKYVAMRIYNPSVDWYGQNMQNLVADQKLYAIYPRIMEFNVYGTWSDPEFDPDSYSVNLNADAIDTTKTITWTDATFQFTDEEGTVTCGMSDAQKIYDYDFETGGYMASNKSFFDLKDGYRATDTTLDGIAKKYTDGTVRYFTMTLQAETEMDLSDIVIVNHKSNAAIRTKSYEVFASDKLSTLFDSGSSVLKYNNATAEKIQNIHFAEGKALKNIKYIAIRIYDPIMNWEGEGLNSIKSLVSQQGLKSIHPRLMEFNAYGVYSDPNYQPPAFAVYNSMDKIDTSKTFQKTLSAYFTMNGESNKVGWTGTDKINDSKVDTGSEFHYSGGTKFCDFKDGYSLNDTDVNGVEKIYTDGSRYLDLTYKFPTEVKVSDILVAQHHMGELMLGNYEIYASADRDTLYTEENFIAKYDSPKGASQIQNFHWEEGKELTDIKYVGMRITNPFKDWNLTINNLVPRQDLALKTLYPRLMEFNVYGEYMDPDFVPEKLTDTASYDLSELTKFGENLVATALPTFQAEGKRAAVRPNFAGDVRNKVREVPSNDVVHLDMTDPAITNKSSFDIQWKLTGSEKLEMYRIKGFAYQGMCRDNPTYYAGHYQIFVAEDAADLYKPENMVFEYNSEEMGVMKGIVYEFPTTMAPVGTYIAIRILDYAQGAGASTENVNPRLSIFYVWGEDPQIIPEPTNLAENMPIDAYFVADKIKEVSESNLTAKEVMNMTDASESTVAKINTKDSDRKTTELIYNLCGDMVVDKIALNLLNNSTTGFGKLKVYASDTLAGVQLDNALIWTQSMKGKSGNVKLSKSITSNDEIRYVRFVFEDCKDYLQINTVYIEGLDNQKNKTRELTSTLDMNSHVRVTNHNTKTNKETTLIFNDAALSSLFDTVSDTYTVVAHGGTVGEDVYDMTIQMDDLRTINQMQFSMMYGFDEYYADKINVYMGETIAEIHGEFAKTEPDYVITKKDFKNQTYIKQMRPRLIRYMKLEFRGFSKIESTQYPDTGKYALTSIIPEMSFKGTKVRGMQTSDESETLISFKDEKTGITATILRLDVNDIFTDVVGIKVTPEKATNWQMTSLKHNPYLKVVNKTNYKIEFVDIYGNVVNDLKGRNVDVSFTVPQGEKVEEFMIGDASVRTKMSVMETSPVNNTVTAGLIWNKNIDMKAALLQMVNEDDSYWSTIGELEDFSEGTEEDLMGDVQEEEHDAEWYKTIRTEDGRFEVTGFDNEIQTGVKFTATDVSDEISDEIYGLLAEISGGKQVAAIYDFSFTLDDQPYVHEGVVDIKLNLPDFIKNSYTDLQVIHLISETSATMPWCETIGDEFYFQTDSFSNFVIIGTAMDSSVGTIIGDSEDDFGADGTSPETGENGITIPVLLGIIAASFVILNTTRKKVR